MFAVWTQQTFNTILPSALLEWKTELVVDGEEEDTEQDGWKLLRET
jgi:hypothetical protein